MALKTSFFIFSCFLLLTNKVYADNCPPHAHAPAPSVYTPPQSPTTPPQAPTAPPTYFPPVQEPAAPPVEVYPPQSPTYPPIYTPQPPDASSPIYFPLPPQSPSSSPTPESPTTYPPLPVTPTPYKHGFCVVECMKRCRTLPAYTGRTRVCVRLCSHCCKANNKCVPGPATTCPAWDTIVYHGVTVKCP